MNKSLFFYSVIGLVSYLIFLVIISSFGANPISLNYRIPLRKEFNRMIPQGWAFFTKDIKNDFFNIYKLESSIKSINKLEIKSSDTNQFFGIKRDNRSIMHKLAYITRNIEKNLWYTHLKKNVNDINEDCLSVVSIEASEPMIFGKFLIERGKPLPYEWSKSEIRIDQNAQYIILNVKKYK